MMREILVCGGSGQVGQELARQVWPRGIRPYFPERSELDLTCPETICNLLQAPERSWMGVINCAAYTAVDRAEMNVAAAFNVNAQGPAWLAEACQQRGLPLLHVSTDYVFDGMGNEFLSEDHPVAPVGAYGASKLAGELAIRSGNSNSIVLRTAWVVSSFRTNFVKTMLRLAEGNSEVRVVSDQFGCPTGAGDIARMLVLIASRQIGDPNCPTGTYHFVNSGDATWFELAEFVLDRSHKRGGPSANVTPITTADYPTPARRPQNSRLSTERVREDFGVEIRHWQEAVAEIVDELVP